MQHERQAYFRRLRQCARLQREQKLKLERSGASRLAEMNPEQVSVDQVLTCLLAELEEMGVDLAPAHKLANIFQEKGEQ